MSRSSWRAWRRASDPGARGLQRRRSGGFRYNGRRASPCRRFQRPASPLACARGLHRRDCLFCGHQGRGSAARNWDLLCDPQFGLSQRKSAALKKRYRNPKSVFPIFHGSPKMHHPTFTAMAPILRCTVFCLELEGGTLLYCRGYATMNLRSSIRDSHI